MTDMMTNLIDLNEYRAANASANHEGKGKGAGARILLFTGVRYERMVEPDTRARIGHA